MSNPSKRKGSAFERLVADYLAPLFPGCDRRVLSGAKDKGDIGGVPGWAIECKATQSIDLAGAMDEARAEAVNAGVPYAVAIIKRRNKGVHDAYAVMTLEQWRKLVVLMSAIPMAGPVVKPQPGYLDVA